MEAEATPAPTAEAADQALAYLAEMSPDVRGAAILGPGGEVLAASGDGEGWAREASALLAAVDKGRDEPAEHVHVATEQGEVFLLRRHGMVAVTVTDRFALASVMSFDMRAVLRDLASGDGDRAARDR
jgi:predicted regulator of Ras-like GTPase activity (Roadblock/LC7/MglB family)